ncbi:MAG: response regulator [Desulfomonile tiedjei]|uniref:histidine kinase n=1 Tax=Desulfomonile tiedjei TaxID=2358 RepID=A0A9D6V9K6_9BACT|nr:response regulator [Desulfomonile tiedjei]
MDWKPGNGEIMIVDDTPENLRLLEGMLRDKGYSVRPFPRGSLALKGAENCPPDLILLDIKMPGMDGYEVCSRLKLNEKLKEIPVIFISALNEPLDKLTAFTCGGVDYVTKPFQVEEVLARVETHIKLRQYQVEIERQNDRLRGTLEQLRSAQTKLVESEKMASLGILTAGIAHEINNPINFITSGISGLKKLLDQVLLLIERYTNLDTAHPKADLKKIDELKEEMDFDDVLNGIKELTASISTGASRAAEIVRSLRIFSRLDENDKKLADINENIDLTLTLLRNQYKDTISIDKQYGHIPQLLCSPGKLNQVFTNILVNAIEAIKSMPIPLTEERIAIKTGIVTEGDTELVEIEIRDSGPGIAKEIRDHIFEPFFTSKEVGKGTGLGLSISQGIVQSHQGTIDVESEPGMGATFRIRLPIKLGQGEP